MTSNQLFIIALLTTLFTVVVPYLITVFFKVNEQKLVNFKLQTEQYKDTIKQLCILAEKMFKESAGQAKYDWVLSKVAEVIKLPKEQLQLLIETSLVEVKATLAEEWDKLGETETPPPTAPPIP